jgi:hypothetical protein
MRLANCIISARVGNSGKECACNNMEYRDCISRTNMTMENTHKFSQLHHGSAASQASQATLQRLKLSKVLIMDGDLLCIHHFGISKCPTFRKYHRLPLVHAPRAKCVYYAARSHRFAGRALVVSHSSYSSFVSSTHFLRCSSWRS